MFAKLAVGEVSPMMLIMLRWFGVVLIALAISHKQLKQYWPILKENFVYLAAMGALGFTVFNGLFYMAAHNTTALNMGIIQGMIPVIVMLGSFIAYQTKVSSLQMIGVAITLLGVCLVATQGEIERLFSLSFNRGDLMILGACILYAGYSIWLTKKPQVPALVWFTALAVSAFAASIPIASIEYALGYSLWPSQTGWVLIGLIILFPSFLAQVFYIRGIELIGANRAGVFVNLVPILASIAAVFVLGEHFYWYHGVALTMVLGGIFIAERWR